MRLYLLTEVLTHCSDFGHGESKATTSTIVFPHFHNRCAVIFTIVSQSEDVYRGAQQRLAKEN